MPGQPFRVQHAIQTFLTARTAEFKHATITTEELCQAAFKTTEATKAQRVSVLRAMKHLVQWGAYDATLQLQWGTIQGMPDTRIGRSINRRAWILMTQAPKRKSPRNRKLAAAMRLLASDQPGEREAALLAMERLLQANGMDWNDLATAFESKLRDP